MLKTSSGYATRGTHSKKPRLHFHMCDFDLAVLARNAVLLEIITEIDPSFDSDMQFIWNVWYNLGLTEIQHQRLCKILDRLCENPFKPRSMSNIDKESTLSKLKGIWLQWRKVGSSLVEMKKIRAEFLKGKNVNKAMKIEQLPVGFSASNVSSRKETMKKQLEEELAAYVKNGTSFSEESLTHPNPTLFRSSIPKYEVHYASNPFESYDISDEFFIPNTKLPFTSQCKNILALWITQFKSCSVSVTLAWMDAFQKCLDCFSENTKFDFIDCSNVGDHDSMLGIMVSASLVLKPGGFLFTGTMLWATLATSLEKYLEMIIGISYYMIPTILGLKLGVDVDLGSSAMISLEGREIRLIWKKIQHSQSPTSLSQGDLLSALLVVFQKCFGLACFDNGSPSAGKPSTSSTVATSILILKHIVQNANLELRDTIEILQR